MPVKWFNKYHNLQNVEAKYRRLGTGLCVFNLIKDQHVMVDEKFLIDEKFSMLFVNAKSYLEILR